LLRLTSSNERDILTCAVNDPYNITMRRLSKLKSIFLAFIILMMAPAYAFYSLEDLEALEREGAFQEFLNHAKDIRPSARTQRWRSMLENVAESYVRQLTTKALFTSDHWNSVESLAQWPELKEVEILQMRRFDYGLAYLKDCFEKNQEKIGCEVTAQNLWANTTMRERLSSQSVNLYVLLKNHAPAQAKWELLTFGLLAPSAEFACQKEEIHEAIITHFQPIIAQDPDEKKLMAQIDDALGEDCMKSLIPNLKDMLFHRSLLVRETAWGILASKNQVDDKTRDLFYLHYLLNDPAKGPLFNLAWNGIKKLGENFTYRSSIIKELDRFDPLPDSLLESSDEKKITTLIKHVNQHVPEYILYYLQQCQAYMTGTKEFAQGNPTKNCRQMLQILKNSRVTLPMQISQLNDLFQKKQ
jgi:hypothetical protein